METLQIRSKTEEAFSLSNPRSLAELFYKWEISTPNRKFLRQPFGSSWKKYTWKSVGEDIRILIGTMQNQGLKKGDRVAILSANCAEWIVCDLAIILGGFVSVPLYANVNSETMRIILEHSGATMMFVGKLLPMDWDALKDSIPPSLHTVTMRGYDKEGIPTWENFIKASVKLKQISPSPDDVITIIYTSGTTGIPKGVVHTNSSIINAAIGAADEVILNRKGNRFISYLPLSHAAERGLVETGALYCGGTISFVESQETFIKNLRYTAPTHFFGVPRVWEKIRSQIQRRITDEKLDQLLKKPIISNIIKWKIKRSLGLHKAIVVLSGAAPVAPDLILWYRKLGIFIREAYGLTEDFNVLSINPVNDIREGTVGKILANQDVVIDPVTCEIKQKCNWLMKGYYEDQIQTEKTIVNGYLNTGDMGKMTDDGFLVLTGRVKDIFKTSKGEYITPRPIELKFLALNCVDQACVMGTCYPQPFILIGLSEFGKNMKRIDVEAELREVLENHNPTVMNYQKLKKVVIVNEEWTSNNNLLTPTLKMKRNALVEKYERALQEIYNEGELVSWE